MKEKATLAPTVPSCFACYALDHAKVEDILGRSHQFPNACLSVRDFTEQWMIPEQHNYVVVEKEQQPEVG